MLTTSPSVKRVKLYHNSPSPSQHVDNQQHQAANNDYTLYNYWRTDSVNNPVWGIRKNTPAISPSISEKSQLFSDRFSFHSSLLQVQDGAKIQPMLLVGECQEALHKQQQEDHARILAGQEVYNIYITEHEQSIFDFLLEVNQRFEMNTVLRVAGGWVRNKLLHMSGDDIDIALDNCMGIQFAEKVLQYEKEKDMPDQYRSIGLISANPDQSKHLETATTHIFGESIDFVNLRCEEYAEDSDNRIPHAIRVGTAEEDAYRRDLTINSMFYNVNEAKVEDFTGRGVDDLKKGIVRTPLPPLKTFLDDPLRVLRAVRFAAFFNFVVADELIQSARNPLVAKALSEKVSRERIGIELGKVLQGPDPVGAFALFREMGVEHIVFALSGNVPKTRKQLRVFENPVSIVWSDKEWDNALFRMRFVFRCALENNFTSEQRAKLVLSAFLSNIVPQDCFHDASKDHFFQVSDKLELWCENLICTSLKQSQQYAKDVCSIIHGAHVLSRFLLKNEQNVNNWSDRYAVHVHNNLFSLASWLRTVKNMFPSACFLSTVYNTTGIEFDESKNIYYVDQQSHGEEMMRALHAACGGRLLEVISMTYVLNGREIPEIAKVKPGTILTYINRELMNWQLQNIVALFQMNEEQRKATAKEWLESQATRFQQLAEELNAQKKK